MLWVKRLCCFIYDERVHGFVKVDPNAGAFGTGHHTDRMTQRRSDIFLTMQDSWAFSLQENVCRVRWFCLNKSMNSISQFVRSDHFFNSWVRKRGLNAVFHNAWNVSLIFMYGLVYINAVFVRNQPALITEFLQGPKPNWGAQSLPNNKRVVIFVVPFILTPSSSANSKISKLCIVWLKKHEQITAWESLLASWFGASFW